MTQHWRHVKTGGVYEVLMHASDEATQYDHVVYRAVVGGRVWVRPAIEFYDGRFVQLVPPGRLIGHVKKTEMDRRLERIQGFLMSAEGLEAQARTEYDNLLRKMK